MIAGIVLAAGESARLGHPKQLAVHEGRTLLRRTVDAALGAACDPLIVVLGAHADRIEGELKGLPVERTVNPSWSEGMSGSIRAGIDALGSRPVDGVLLMTCDQLHIDDAILRRLCETFDGKPGRMVACAYADTVGVPALFESSLFGELRNLHGDRGAKQLLLDRPDDLVTIPWPNGNQDVDYSKTQ